ncbi:hypothetical protein ACTXT7_012847 [Hymenolepis weldensis]
MLLREFNKSDYYLCPSYLQPIDSAYPTYEKMISKFGSVVSDNSSQFNLTLSEDENITIILLSLLDKEPDFKKSRHRPESAAGMLVARSENDLSSIDPLPINNYPTNIRSHHSQDATFAENIVIIETALSKTSLPELQQQWAHRRLLPRIFYEQFNEAEPE